MVNQWVLAFDFGMHRIGTAVGNTAVKIPHPLVTINARNLSAKFREIAQLIDKWRPSQLVVGVPSDTATHQELILKITRFSNRLKHEFKLPVTQVIEDYTSSVASIQLNEQHIYARAQTGKLDTLAACAILQSYFNRIA